VLHTVQPVAVLSVQVVQFAVQAEHRVEELRKNPLGQVAQVVPVVQVAHPVTQAEQMVPFIQNLALQAPQLVKLVHVVQPVGHLTQFELVVFKKKPVEQVVQVEAEAQVVQPVPQLVQVEAVEL